MSMHAPFSDAKEHYPQFQIYYKVGCMLTLRRDKET